MTWSTVFHSNSVLSRFPADGLVFQLSQIYSVQLHASTPCHVYCILCCIVVCNVSRNCTYDTIRGKPRPLFSHCSLDEERTGLPRCVVRCALLPRYTVCSPPSARQPLPNTPTLRCIQANSKQMPPPPLLRPTKGKHSTRHRIKKYRPMTPT
jgi:hypothetical protein